MRRTPDDEGLDVNAMHDAIVAAVQAAEAHAEWCADAPMTPECPPLRELLLNKTGDFGAQRLDHLSRPCAYCDESLRLTFAQRCPSPTLLAIPGGGEGAIGAAVRRHVSECRDCEHASAPAGPPSQPRAGEAVVAATAPIASAGPLDRSTHHGGGRPDAVTVWWRPRSTGRTGRTSGRGGAARRHLRRRRILVTATGSVSIAVLLVAVLVAAVIKGAASIPSSADIRLGTACRAELSDPKPSQVVVAAVWADRERARFQQVLATFERESGLDVIFASRDPDPDRDLGNTLRTLSDRECPPDVVLVPQPGLLQDLAEQKRIYPIDEMEGIRQLVEQNYTEVWRELGSHAGRLYGVWLKAANKSMIWYNARAFERAGVSPPTDLEGLKSVAGQLASHGIKPFAVSGHDLAGWTLTDWFENIYLQMAGPEMYGRLASHEIPWTHPTVTAALEEMASILRPEWIADGVGGALKTTYEQSVHQVFDNLDEPGAAMMLGADYVANELANTSAQIGTDARFFPFPSVSGKPPAVVGGADQAGPGEVGGDVALLMKDRPQARQLLEFLAKPEAPRPWASAGGFISPNRELEVDPQTRQHVPIYPNEPTRQAAQALTNAAAVTFDLSDLQTAKFGSTPGRGMWKIFQTFLEDLARVPDAARTVAKTADSLEREYCRTTPAETSTKCQRAAG